MDEISARRLDKQEGGGFIDRLIVEVLRGYSCINLFVVC